MTFTRRAELLDISDQHADQARNQRTEAYGRGLNEQQLQTCPNCGQYGIACRQCSGEER